MSSRFPHSKPAEPPLYDLSQYDFDFSGCNTQYLTHGLHGYPARMPPQIPKTIFHYYLRTGTLSPDATVFDPFAGSGTTGVEAQLCGLKGTLLDLNPLAALIAKVKTTPIDSEQIYTAAKHLIQGKQGCFRTSLQEDLSHLTDCFETNQAIPVEEPEVSSRFEWFPKPQLYHLAVIRRRIDHLERAFPKSVVNVLRLSLSAVVRDVSYQRTGEYKRYRIPQGEWEEHNPDVLGLFQKELSWNTDIIGQYDSVVHESSRVNVFQEDARTASSVADNHADIVVTSPPYGDHETTVAYGQYSLDPAVISMDVSRDRMKNVDKEGLGGSKETIDSLSTISPTLDSTIQQLEAVDGRSQDALSFFTDYYQVLQQIQRILKPNQPAVLVVANRQMSGIQVPTHIITTELLKELRFTKEAIISRELPYKTLPYKNSPSNVVGETGEMMSDENIVIARNTT